MLIPSITAGVSFLKKQLGEVTAAAVAGATDSAATAAHDKAADTSATVKQQLGGAIERLAENVSNNEKVQKAVDKLGQIASKPTKKALEPHIIAATVAAIVAIAVIVYLARKQ